MKSCSVPLCENDTYKRPDLKYFPLPKNVNIRDEWLEALGMKRASHHSKKISICEVHFRDLDFTAGKRDLKVHAVPVLSLGAGIVDQIDEEDEFLEQSICASIKTEMDNEGEWKKATSASAKKRPLTEDQIKQEPDPIESETGRRPSRRAAVLAAQKISNTVRHYGVKDNDPDDPNSRQTNPTPTRKIKMESSKQKKVSIDLEMFCVDEDLSSVQIAYMKRIEEEYNMGVKNLKDLAACNCKIIQVGGRPIDLSKPVAHNSGGVKVQKVKPLPIGVGQLVPIVEYSEPKLKIIYI